MRFTGGMEVGTNHGLKRRDNHMIARIAFLFLTIADIYHEPIWLSFLQGHENEYTLYVHSKKPLPEHSFFKSFELESKIPTTWANTMEAQVELLRIALENEKNEKFVFVSESTIPLQSFSEVYNALMSDPNSLFHFSHMSHGRTFRSVKEWDIYKNAQWVVLNRKHAQLMVEDTTLIHSMAKSPHDQEHYPATFLAKKKLLSEVTKKDMTLVIWSKEHANTHPHSFRKLENDSQLSRLIGAITDKKFLFARKFEKKCDLSLLKPYLMWWS